jgi:hypothetical protein
MVVPHKKEGRNFKGRPLQKKKKTKRKKYHKKELSPAHTHSHNTKKTLTHFFYIEPPALKTTQTFPKTTTLSSLSSITFLPSTLAINSFKLLYQPIPIPIP